MEVGSGLLIRLKLGQIVVILHRHTVFKPAREFQQLGHIVGVTTYGFALMAAHANLLPVGHRVTRLKKKSHWELGRAPSIAGTRYLLNPRIAAHKRSALLEPELQF